MSIPCQEEANNMFLRPPSVLLKVKFEKVTMLEIQYVMCCIPQEGIFQRIATKTNLICCLECPWSFDFDTSLPFPQLML